MAHNTHHQCVHLPSPNDEWGTFFFPEGGVGELGDTGSHKNRPLARVKPGSCKSSLECEVRSRCTQPLQVKRRFPLLPLLTPWESPAPQACPLITQAALTLLILCCSGIPCEEICT